VTESEQKWIETHNQACGLLRLAHDLLACSSLPPRRTWVGLTDEEMLDCLTPLDAEAKRLPLGFKWFAQAIEAKLKEKNNG
jgi:hypothetical protein